MLDTLTAAVTAVLLLTSILLGALLLTRHADGPDDAPAGPGRRLLNQVTAVVACVFGTAAVSAVALAVVTG